MTANSELRDYLVTPHDSPDRLALFSADAVALLHNKIVPVVSILTSALLYW